MSSKVVNIAVVIAFFTVLMAYGIGFTVLDSEHSFKLIDVVGQLTLVQFALLTCSMLLVWKFGPRTQQLTDYKFILIAAVLLRVLLIPVDPYTSNDVDRYLFDGFIAASGLDPYSISHDAEQLASVIEQWAPPPEHAKYVTLYPPLAISLYAFAANFGPHNALLVWSIIIALASIATLFFCMLSLRLTHKLHHTALVALSPILLLEAGVGLHIDTFAALFVAMSVYFWLKHKYLLVGITIALGALVKLFPLVLMGPLFLYASSWKHKGLLVLGFIGCVTCGYATAFLIGWVPVGSVGVFFEKFRFGSPLFALLEHYFVSSSLIYAVFGIMLVAYAALAFYSFKAGKNQHIQKLFGALQLSLSIPLLLGPVVYPWYLMSLVPVFVMAPRMWLLIWMSLLPSTYEVLSQWLCCHQWSPATWPLILISIGVSVGVLIGVFHKSLSPITTKFVVFFTSPIKRSEVN